MKDFYDTSGSGTSLSFNGSSELWKDSQKRISKRMNLALYCAGGGCVGSIVSGIGIATGSGMMFLGTTTANPDLVMAGKTTIEVFTGTGVGSFATFVAGISIR